MVLADVGGLARCQEILMPQNMHRITVSSFWCSFILSEHKRPEFSPKPEYVKKTDHCFSKSDELSNYING
jgi:hypothetical protein